MKGKTSSTAARLALAGTCVAFLVVLLLGLPAVAGATILEASATAATTTTSTTDVLMAGMTLTPGAGDYLAVFSTSVKATSASNIFVSIYVNGVQQAHTERRVFQESSIAGFEQPLMTYAHIAVGAGQAVEIKWRTDVANTITANARTLNLFPVASADVSQATATADATLNSSTYTLLNSMTLTPGAGTYLAVFSTSAQGVSGAVINASLFVGGTQVAHTERSQTQEPSIPQTSYVHAIIAKVVPTAGQAVEVRWNNTGTAGIITAHQRTLTLYKVNATDIFEATATADTTSTATTDALLASMTLTPGAENYLAFFSSSFFYGTISVSPVTFHSLYVNGVKVAQTERQPIHESSIDSTNIPVATNGVVSPGAGQAVEVRWRSSTADTRTAHERTFLLLKQATTTIGNGTDPASTTIAPSGPATMADAFTFATSFSTDSVTAVTVALAAGTSGGLSLVEITNDAGSTVYGSVANPADTQLITLATPISVTTTATQYKIRITPKTHASMPAPSGSSYAVTASISAWTGTNTQAGTDSAGTTVTIDNLSPANVTGAGATAGDAQVTVSWTNPGDVDFSNVVVLRNTATITDVPVEGSSPAVNATIGTSIVRYISNGTSFIDTGLTNGTPYFYRVFTKDSSGNYSATGVEVSATPVPAGAIAPRAGAQAGTTTTTLTINKPTGTVQNDVMIASIGFRLNSPGQNSTDIGITPPLGWTPVSGFGGVVFTNGRIDNPTATGNGLAVYYKVAGASEPASHTWTFFDNGPTWTTVGFQSAAGGIVSFSGVDTTTPIDRQEGRYTAALDQRTPSITTTVANTMLVASHTYATATTGPWTQNSGMTPTGVDIVASNQSTLMSYVLQAAAGATGQKQATPTPDDDQGNAHILALRPAPQCAAVADASYAAVSATSTAATVYWSSANPVLILRKSGGSVTDTPAGGTTYSAGNSIGSSTVVYSGSVAATSVLDTVAGRTTTDRYKVFAKTASPCYAPGLQVDASVPSGTAWSYAMASLSGNSMLKPGIVGNGTIYPSSMSSRIISLSTADGTRSWDPISSTGAIQGWLTWLPVGSASLKAVQTGTGSIGAGALSAVLPISPALTDTTKTILVFQAVPGNSATVIDSAVRCALTSTTTITCDREGTIGAVPIRWYTVEFSGNVKVQHLTGTDCDAVDGTSEISIPTPVQSMSRTFLLYSQKAQGGGHGSDDFRTVRLLNTSQVEIRELPAGCIAGYAYALQVVEHPGVSVTRGLVGSMAAGTSSVSVSSLSAVVPTKTMLLYSWRGDRYLAAMCSVMVRGEMNSATSLLFTRGDGAGAACDGLAIDDIAWERIEFTDGAVVQQVQAAMAAGVATADVSIASVDTTRTVAFSAGQYTGGQAAGEGSFSTDDIVGTMLGLHELTSSTNLRVTRGDTSGSARWTSYVVQFPLSGGAPLVFGGDQSGRVYSVDTTIGATNWGGTALTGADAFQAGVSAQVRAWSNAAFQAAYTDDVIFAATWNAIATSNKVFALGASNGAVLWTFQDAGNGVDYIAGQPWVDYARNRIYVASRAGSGGGQPSLWVIKTVDGEGVLKGQAMACPACTVANRHFETSPTLSYDGNTLYIGATDGTLYAINAGALTLKWTLDLGGAPAKISTAGFVWEDYTTAGRLYFVTADGNVRCVQDNGGSGSACTGWSVTTVAGAATPLLLNKLFVGANDGTVRQINLTNGTQDKQFPAAGSLDGTPLGAISTETGNEIFVGTNGGKIFKINLTSGALP